MFQGKIRSAFRLGAVLAAVTLVALPAGAAVYTITLTTGSEFETQYQPVQAPYDEGKIMFLTEHGNWISLSKELVTSIESDFESRGFGIVLDTNTVLLGYSINDLPEDAEGGQTSAGDRLLEILGGQPAEPFTVQQFVEPNSAGGLPLGFTGSTTPPLGSSGGEPPIAGDNR